MSSGYNKSRNNIKKNRESKNANLMCELHTSLILTSQGRSQGYLYSVQRTAITTVLEFGLCIFFIYFFK